MDAGEDGEGERASFEEERAAPARDERHRRAARGVVPDAPPARGERADRHDLLLLFRRVQLVYGLWFMFFGL